MRYIEKKYSFLWTALIHFIVIIKQPFQFVVSFLLFIIIPSGVYFTVFYFFQNVLPEWIPLWSIVRMISIFFFIEYAGMLNSTIEEKQYSLFSGYSKNTVSFLLAAVFLSAALAIIDVLVFILFLLGSQIPYMEMITLVVALVFLLIMIIVIYGLVEKKKMQTAFKDAMLFFRDNIGKFILLIGVVVIFSLSTASVILSYLPGEWKTENQIMIPVFLRSAFHILGSLLYPIVVVIYVKLTKYKDREIKEPLARI